MCKGMNLADLVVKKTQNTPLFLHFFAFFTKQKYGFRFCNFLIFKCILKQKYGFGRNLGVLAKFCYSFVC